MRSGEEIQGDLHKVVARWRDYSGSEPENYEEPLFGDSYKELTTEATKVVTRLYQALLLRKAAAPETLRSFLLQIVWCLFAEDLGMLEGHPTQRIIEDLVRHPERTSYAELGTLFDVLNDLTDDGRHGVLHGIRYVNGSLFAKAAKVHLQSGELAMLVEPAQFDWRTVDPTIFGSLMEGCLGRDRRWELGAHHTHEVDIMKIVRPTIMQPWRSRIDRTRTVADVLRYTPSSVFETFPWPDPVTEKQRDRVAEASRNVIARRQQICATNSFGLTTPYNLIDEGAYTDLKALHGELDEAVAAAYGMAEGGSTGRGRDRPAPPYPQPGDRGRHTQLRPIRRRADIRSSTTSRNFAVNTEAPATPLRDRPTARSPGGSLIGRS